MSRPECGRVTEATKQTQCPVTDIIPCPAKSLRPLNGVVHATAMPPAAVATAGILPSASLRSQVLTDVAGTGARHCDECTGRRSLRWPGVATKASGGGGRGTRLRFSRFCRRVQELRRSSETCRV